MNKSLSTSDSPELQKYLTLVQKSKDQISKFSKLCNAMKFGAEKLIAISTKVENGNVVIMVQDQGIGISREDQAKLFNRYERVMKTDFFPGLGLGLFISQQIVIVHGGSIKIESELGKGATFIVELPLQPKFEL